VGTSGSDTGQTAKGSVEVREPTKLEQASARRVAESKATIPHIYLDAELAVAGGESSDLTAHVIKAAADALRQHPALNGAYRDGRFETYSRVNVGVTISGEGAAVVPTIFDADTLDPVEIATRLDELRRAVNEGTLTSPQLAGGTFTVTVLESPAVTRLTPVINAGQAATLAVAGAGRVIGATLACDNRMVGAPEGAAFLEAVQASFARTA
jgi:pyruvate dehydrogenase E2 component (dihydrolipoamide acetyltransferase)